MRPLEIIMVLLNIIALVLVYLPARVQQRWFKFLPVALVVITIAHLLLEHYRWQMVPPYLLPAVLFLRALPSLLKNSAPTPARGAGAVILGGLGFLCALIAITLP